MKQERTWRKLPLLTPPSPVFALATQGDVLWVGGVGGLASRSLSQGEQAVWRQESGTLPLSSISVLLTLDSLLLAGGSEGIAYSYAGRADWQRAMLEDGVASITAFAASPQFASDSTIVAATLANGILRTNDGGSTWRNASFGLESMEVTTLVWEEGTSVLAVTSDGIYRSRDAGRAWRRIYAEEELEIEALLILPDKTWLAASATRGLLRSHDSGKSWNSVPGLENIQAFSLCRTPAGTLLLSTIERGFLRSSDGGETWHVLDNLLIVNTYNHDHLQVILAGTTRGLITSSNDGISWEELPPPPINDLHTLLTNENHLLISSRYSGIIRKKADNWEAIENIPQPLTTSALLPDVSLLLSDPDGLHRLQNETLQTLIEGETGHAAHITWHQEQLWATSIDNKRLLHSNNAGTSWQSLPLPFGTAPVVALQAIPDRLIAATYDPLQYRIQVWYSTDNGQSWARSLEAHTAWPIVATCVSPAALSIGNILFLEQKDQTWQQIAAGEENSGIRRIISIQYKEKTTLFILTTSGLHRSDNRGESWQKQEIDIPGEQIIDIATSGTSLTLLLSEGRVWQWDIQDEASEQGEATSSPATTQA
ncbi:MAG TPA: hypothetical protein VFN35_37030 [Ktedonobacteraceae bacterium]|nr:hypothetical protein [Ktedonobacteraceae bacterium]